MKQEWKGQSRTANHGTSRVSRKVQNRAWDIALLALLLAPGMLMSPMGLMAQSSAGAGTEAEAQAILARLESVMAPDNYRMELTMTTVRRGSERSLEMVIFYKKNVGSFIEVQAPVRSRGLRFLQREGALWIFNPRAGGSRAVRLSPQDDFQGTVFSNGDLSDPQYTQDYQAVLLGQEDHALADGSILRVNRLEARAIRDTSPYGRIVILVTVEDNIPLRMEYFARSGLLFKTMTLEQIEFLAGRRRPRLWTMESHAEEGAQTRILIRSLELRDNSDSLFSQGSLTR